MDPAGGTCAGRREKFRKNCRSRPENFVGKQKKLGGRKTHPKWWEIWILAEGLKVKVCVFFSSCWVFWFVVLFFLRGPTTSLLVPPKTHETKMAMLQLKTASFFGSSSIVNSTGLGLGNLFQPEETVQIRKPSGCNVWDLHSNSFSKPQMVLSEEKCSFEKSWWFSTWNVGF